MAIAKFDVEKFNGENNFSLLQMKMWALLVHYVSAKALKVRDALSKSLADKDKNEIIEKAYNTLLLCLGDNKILQKFLRRILQ